jgi:hypothetical protein
MKQFVTAGTLAVALAVGGTALAQQPPPPAKTPPAAKTDQAEKPAAKPAAKRSTSSADKEAAAHTAPKAQPATTENPNATDTAMALGTVRLTKAVKADGKELAAICGAATAEEAKPDAKGSEVLERWVGRQGGKVAAARSSRLSRQPRQNSPRIRRSSERLSKCWGGDYMRPGSTRVATTTSSDPGLDRVASNCS